MMKKYKVVDVYCGYGEMSINGGVEVVEGKSLKSVCVKLLKEKKKFFKEDKSYFEEFVNVWGVKGKVGSIGGGEEGYDLVFEEGSEWFEKIDRNDDWNDEEWNEWLKLNEDGLEFDEEGKI